MTKREKYISTRNRLAVLALFLCVFSGAMAQSDLSGSGTPEDPYLITSDDDYSTFVAIVNDDGTGPVAATKYYKITGDINASGVGSITRTFSGTLWAEINSTTNMPYRIKNLSVPLFATLTGTVKNLVLEDVNIPNTTSGNVGAIAASMEGTSTNIACIYNCGILSGSVGGTGHVGGLVGDLGVSGNTTATNNRCYARVINCYSFANITGGSDVAGIVGYNNYETKATNIRTMVMNCMFYGDITGGTNTSPVYGGKNINNLNSGGLNTFNYYAYDKLKTTAISNGKYNCALAVEERYLNRIEFYRLLLNSNKRLAAYYATGSIADADQMAKWVLETADRSINTPYPYPILKSQGTATQGIKYPSIINIDAEHAPDSSAVGPNKGGKLGKTLSVTINSVGSNAPTGAAITNGSITLNRNRTDKDFDRFNFNYDKVQLPYYDEVGTGNYGNDANNKSRVVTGWKITHITTLTGDPYTSDNYDYNKAYSGTNADPDYFDYPNYNFADRRSSNKDLYSVSGRVFSQGAYFDVPYGVSSITIEPYWGMAAYVADEYLDVVCKAGTVSGRNAYIPESVTQLGKQFSNGKITLEGNEQNVRTSISSALNDLSGVTDPTVYDYAVVLVGNLHHIGVPSGGDKPFTLMSVDLDKDNEPDYSLIYCDNDRHTQSPLRFDFLNVPGAAQAQKPNGTGVLLNAAIFRTKGWFEITNTALMYFSQYEYENQGTGDNVSVTKTNAPLILLGGYIDQFVSTQSTRVDGKTIYIHVGGNVLINSFGMGTHGDGSKATPHVPVSVTGGDYLGFYLSGTYNPNAGITDDNAECYISGGRFKELAGASQEQIGNNTNGNVNWQIYNADITDFYGGGLNDAKPVQGNIKTDIFNSNVTTFCGGPKFGNMASNKTVITTATGCTFGKFFGAGYGGNSYSRKKYFDNTSYNFTNLQKYYYAPGSSTTHENERGKFYNGTSTNCPNANYGKKGPGVATDFDYEFFVWTSGANGARFYIMFASFSLAQCNNVTSTLTGCTINENFYGGGSLGKVTGKVTSILENCKVKGNVYGAGYSATLPTIEVRNEGFSKIPVFNSASGMFEMGEKSGTTTFNWQHKENYPNNGTAGFLTDDGSYSISEGTNVVTKVDITPSNLGSVAGNVSLTLKGNTVVGTEGVSTTGNVFGGGAMSVANGNVSVTLQDETKVLNNVYGGGDQGKVDKNTTVILQDGTHVEGNVYGGGNNGPVEGDSKVIIQDETNTTTEP